MNLFHRALFYITRKKNKSILLFFILLFMSVFVLTGLGIQNASRDTAAALRERLGGYFRLRANNGTPWIDDALIERIMTIEGIKDYNAMNVFYLHTELTLTPGRFAGEIDPQFDNQKNEPRFLGNTSSERYEYFLTNACELVEGEHLTGEDRGKVLISERLAEDNQLSIGSSFTADITEDLQVSEGMEKNIGKEYTLEVAGIYRINSKKDSSAFTPECDIVENYIFIDSETGKEIVNDLRGRGTDRYQYGADFFVKDPKELDTIIKQAEELDEERENHFITVNDVVYQTSAAPLEKLGAIMTVLIMVVLVVCVILLSLILTMWIKERIHEIGIYLSIGIKKGGVVGQFLTECIGVFLIAFVLAAILSAGIGSRLGSYITQSAVGTEQEEEEENGDKKQDEDAIIGDYVKNTIELKIAIGWRELAGVAAAGVATIILSVGIASVTVFRLKPKSILSSMS
ncbi:ABC transporter permease [Anaerolentibacter hominis]|uniref:ABC transporter permease n=1 Tax=Anaerolentibacter hominis TaxID=3079009 RepID=UPI0031B7FF50